MTADERTRLVALYRDGYRAVAEALLDVSDDVLDARPADGRWTIREIVHHLADSEMTAAVRLRLLLAEERPVIQAYDQDEFARRLYYDRPHEVSLQAFRYVRECTAQLLERMSESDWLREGQHSEVGAFGAVKWLEIYAPHAHRHARQILEARGAATSADG